MQKSIHSADYQHFLAELRAQRERLGLSQEQLAAALGEHQTLVSKVERGVRRLDIIELRNWLAAMNVRLSDFIATLEGRLSRHTLPLGRQKRTR